MPYTIGQVRDLITESTSKYKNDQLNIIDTILHTLGFSQEDDYEHIIYCHNMVHDELSKKTTMDPSLIERALISILDIPEMKKEYNMYEDESENECSSRNGSCTENSKTHPEHQSTRCGRYIQHVHFAFTILNTGLLLAILFRRQNST